MTLDANVQNGYKTGVRKVPKRALYAPPPPPPSDGHQEKRAFYGDPTLLLWRTARPVVMRVPQHTSMTRRETSLVLEPLECCMCAA